MTDDRRKLPRPVTPDRLEAAALAYLERFMASSAQLRRVLLRRVDRSARLHGTDPAEGRVVVEALVARLAASRLIDDRAFAAAKAASLHRGGASARAIAARLAAKGIAADLRDAALAEHDDAAGSAPRPGGDLAAAAALARRRRLGPYRPEPARAAFRQKDLATLARAGFARGVAERVLGAADPAALQGLVEETAEGG